MDMRSFWALLKPLVRVHVVWDADTGSPAGAGHQQRDIVGLLGPRRLTVTADQRANA